MTRQLFPVLNTRSRRLRWIAPALVGVWMLPALSLLPEGGLRAPLVQSVAQAKVPVARKIAIVDVQRVLTETRAGKRARRSMEASAKAKQQKLQKKQAKLEADMKKAQALEGEQLMAAQQRLQRQYGELQQMMYTLQQDLAQQETRLLEEMYRNVQRIVKSMATKQGIDLVLVRDPGTVIHTREVFDITSAVVRAYDRKHPK